MTNYLINIKTLKAVIIKCLLEVIKPYIKEVNMMITSEYIKISTMDTTKESITYIKLDAKKFEHYYCEKPIIIGVDVDSFYTTIKTATRRETITFFIEKDKPYEFCIQLADTLQGKVKKYNLKLLELGDKIIDINQLTFDYKIVIPTIQFQHIMKDIQLIGGKILEIKCINKQVIFSCNDSHIEFKTTISEINEELNKEQKLLLQQNGENIKTAIFEQFSNAIVQGKFKMSYLLHFIKATSLCDTVSILITNDQPLVLEYFVADLGVLRLLLMPIDTRKKF